MSRARNKSKWKKRLRHVGWEHPTLKGRWSVPLKALKFLFEIRPEIEDKIQFLYSNMNTNEAKTILQMALHKCLEGVEKKGVVITWGQVHFPSYSMSLWNYCVDNDLTHNLS